MLREKGKKCRQGEIFLVFYVSLFLVFYGLVGFLWFLIVFFWGGLRETAKDVTLVALQKQGTNGRLKERFRAGRLHRKGGREGTDTKTNE